MIKLTQFTSTLLLFCILTAGVQANSKSPSTSDFFGYPSTLSVSINPSGSQLAFINLDTGSARILLGTPQTTSTTIAFDTEQYTEKNSTIGSITWLDDQYLAIQFTEVKEGITDLLDTKINKRLLILDTLDLSAPPKSVRTTGWLAHPLPSQKGVFLYGRSRAYSKLYRIEVSKLAADTQKLGKLDKIDGGQFIKSNETQSISGFVTKWFFDETGDVKGALSFNRDGELELNEYRSEGDETTTQLVHSWTVTDENKKKKKRKETQDHSLEHFLPMIPTSRPSVYYCLDIDEENERKIYEVDFSNKSFSLAYETNAYKIVEILLNSAGDLAGVKVLKNGRIGYEYIDSTRAKNTEKPSRLYTEFDSTLDKAHSLIYQEGHSQPGRFFYKNNTTGQIREIGKRYNKLPKELETDLIANTVSVEGLSIPYLLTLPNTKGPAPLIVMPHGGPVGVFDDHYYDPFVQHFAAQGYAVLRVNFRGSSGHTKELEDAGTGEWGNLMLEDIVQATKAAMKHPNIDSTKVAAAGLSYGGYAATMLTINHPNIYQCGVNIAGISDLNLFVRSAWQRPAQKEWLADQILVPLQKQATEKYVEHKKKDKNIKIANEVLDQLYQASPAYLTHKLQRPLFIGHGENDTVVDIEHAYRLKLQLEKYRKSFVWKSYEEADHSFSEKDLRIKMVNDITEFLSVYL